MRDIRVCFIGSNDTSKLLANKSTVSDIEVNHYSHGSETITFINPISFPEKIKTLIQAVNLSDYVVVEINELNKYFGEIIILLDLLGKRGEFIVPIDKQYLIEQVRTIIKGTRIENYEFRIINSNEDIKLLKDDLLKIETPYGQKPLIMIDHFFNVKNVGTVALGFTLGGTINAKDKMTLLPGGKQIQVNSLQVMDVDYKEINAPARVGIALKNCSIDDLERGSIISNELKESKEITGELIKSKYYKKEFKNFMTINGLLARQGELKESKVILEKTTVVLTDTIIYDDAENPRVIGIIKKQ